MARSLIGLWLTLVAAVTAMIVLAQFWIQGRQASAGVRVQTILLSQLRPIDESISRVIADYEISLQRQVSNCQFGDLEQCVELSRYPLTHALVVINEDGQLHFPTDMDRLSRERQSLVDEALQLLREQRDPRPRRTVSNGLNSSFNLMPSQTDAQSALAQQAAPQTELAQETESLRSKSYQSRVVPQTDRTTRMAQLLAATEDSVQAEDSMQAEDQVGQQQGAAPQTATPPESSRQGFRVSPSAAQPTSPQRADNAGPPTDQFGWITWYHRRGMELGFWWHDQPSWRILVVLPRARWMADIVASLPDRTHASSKAIGKTATAPTLAGSLKQLVDVEGNIIYQWGDAPGNLWDQLELAEPTAELAVSEPLEGWRLRVYATDELARQLAGDAMIAPIWLAVGGISLALVLGGLMLTINLNRQMRLAASRVSFVNQVSHELRTPLTNICMYADLLANDIDNGEVESTEESATLSRADSRQLDRISVIQNESRRLNRLISNVLEFARSSNHSKKIHRRACVLDDLIHEILETFRPRLEELGFRVETNLNTDEARLFDPDIVEQILVNLVGNAEKYAAEGQWLSVTTQADQEQIEIRIQDAGPGIPVRMAQRVFSPFERVSDRLEDPAGTGIGLTIVRELARKHGGDCRLESSRQGALFCCTIQAPLANTVGDR